MPGRMVVALSAKQRPKRGKELAALRAKGGMPAVVYGPKLAPVPVEVSLGDFSKVLEKAGESTVIDLLIDGASHHVLIHEIDRDPVTETPRHADFYAIVKGQKVKVKISLVFSGESDAVKEGANLVKALHEVEVEADPMHLPHELSVDLSLLSSVGTQVLAKDITLPSGVSLVTSPADVVATVLEAKEEVVEEVATPDMATIGISEERGKEEEEGEVAQGATEPK